MSSGQDGGSGVGGEGNTQGKDSVRFEQGHVEAVESMGFSRVQAERGLRCGDGTITGAIEWILRNDEEFADSGVSFSDSEAISDSEGGRANRNLSAERSSAAFEHSSLQGQFEGRPTQIHELRDSKEPPAQTEAKRFNKDAKYRKARKARKGEAAGIPPTNTASYDDPDFPVAPRKQHKFDKNAKAGKTGVARKRMAPKTPIKDAPAAAAAAAADPTLLSPKAHPELETIPAQERGPISLSYFDPPDRTGAPPSKQKVDQKRGKEQEEQKRRKHGALDGPGVPPANMAGNTSEDAATSQSPTAGAFRGMPDWVAKKQNAYRRRQPVDKSSDAISDRTRVDREPFISPLSHDDDFSEPPPAAHSAVPGATAVEGVSAVPGATAVEGVSAVPGATAVSGVSVVPGASSTPGREATTESSRSNAPTEANAQEAGNSGGHVVPTAYTVDEHIVEAQNVLPEDELGGRRRISRKCAAVSLVSASCVVAAVVLATLGVAGQLGDRDDDEPEEFAAPTPAPTSAPRACSGSNCWVQKGPDLRARAAGDEFASVVSLADSMTPFETRIAVSAPESHAGGIDSGLVRVYDIADDDAGGAYWAQVGQDIVGDSGDEILGCLSGDGMRLAVGAWLNDGAGGNRGSIGQVRVFELRNGGNWTMVGKPIYGEETNERFGRRIALNIDGTVVAASAQLTSGTIRIYEELDGEWVKRGNSIQSGGPNAEFGRAVSMNDNGDIVCIGAQGHSNDRGVESGIVRVYRLENNAWTPLGDQSNLQGEAEGDGFGSRVHLGRNGMGVAVRSGGKSEVNGTQMGSHVIVFAYDRESMSWERVGTPIWGPASAISLSHDMERLAIGSSQKNNDTGSVRAYHLTNGAWQQLGGEISGREERGSFGSALALDGEGNTLVIGGSPGGRLRLHGVVRVFELPYFQDIPDISGLELDDRFGNNVQLSGDGRRVVISVSANAVGGEDAGSVRVFDIENGAISPIGQELHGVGGDELVGYLAKNGMRMAVGARRNDGINGTQRDIGKVSVYELNYNGNWTLLGDPIYGEKPKDRAGKEAAISDDGSLVAVTSPIAAGRGQTRVFRYTNMEWRQVGSTLEGVNADDQFGWQVSLSSDGAVMAVSSRHNNDYGDRSGLVKVYRFDEESGDYSQMGNDIFGDVGDEAGKGISLSGDGMILAVSMTGSDANGEDSGMARVFSFDETSNRWRQRGGNITGASAHDGLIRVSLAPNGNRIATAAHSAGEETGYVDVYDFVLGEWKRVGGKIWGQKPGQGFGWAISLSSDGTRLAVGAPARNADGPAYGLVRLFKLPAIYEPPKQHFSGLLAGLP